MEMQESTVQDKDFFGISDFSFRRIRESDLDLLLQWRNSDRIHQLMLTDHLITPEEHKAWFERMCNGQIVWGLMFCYKGEAIGYQGFSMIDREFKIYSPGSYLGKTFAIPPETGIFMQFLSKEYAFSILKAEQLNINILECNTKSLKITKFFGYTFNQLNQAYVIKKGMHVKIIKGLLTKQQWNMRRLNIMEMIGIDKAEWEKKVTPKC